MCPNHSYLLTKQFKHLVENQFIFPTLKIRFFPKIPSTCINGDRERKVGWRISAVVLKFQYLFDLCKPLS